MGRKHPRSRPVRIHLEIFVFPQNKTNKTWTPNPKQSSPKTSEEGQVPPCTWMRWRSSSAKKRKETILSSQLTSRANSICLLLDIHTHFSPTLGRAPLWEGRGVLESALCSRGAAKVKIQKVCWAGEVKGVLQSHFIHYFIPSLFTCTKASGFAFWIRLENHIWLQLCLLEHELLH